MNKWLCSQFMAPVYALVISFFAAFLLGAAMPDSPTKSPGVPTTQTPAPTGKNPKVIRLVTQQDNHSDKEPVTVAASELRGTVVRISYTTSGEDLKVDANGEIPLGDAAAIPVTVCVALPAHWEARVPAPVEQARGFTCWVLANLTGETTLVVAKVGS